MPSPRAIAVPIFARSPVPFGRLSDTAEALRDKGEDMTRMAIRPAGSGAFDGYLVHRFPSADALAAAIAEDASRCPRNMGGGTRGMGPAPVGWRPLAGYLRK